MIHPNTSLILSIVLLLGCSPATEIDNSTDFLTDGLLTEPDEGFNFLFNAKNMEGWHIITEDGPEEGLFTVDNGSLHSYATQEGRSVQTF